jgi:hypothetical protein
MIINAGVRESFHIVVEFLLFQIKEDDQKSCCYGTQILGQFKKREIIYFFQERHNVTEIFDSIKRILWRYFFRKTLRIALE